MAMSMNVLIILQNWRRGVQNCITGIYPINYFLEDTDIAFIFSLLRTQCMVKNKPWFDSLCLSIPPITCSNFLPILFFFAHFIVDSSASMGKHMICIYRSRVCLRARIRIVFKRRLCGFLTVWINQGLKKWEEAGEVGMPGSWKEMWWSSMDLGILQIALGYDYMDLIHSPCCVLNHNQCSHKGWGLILGVHCSYWMRCESHPLILSSFLWPCLS